MPPDAIAGGTTGAVGICLLVFGALKAGWLRTGQEVTAVKEQVEIQRARAERAEKQVDVAMSNNGQIIHGVIEQLRKPTA